MDFSDLFSNGKPGGPGPRRVDRAARLESTVDRGGAEKRARWRLDDAWCVGARGCRCSPAVAEEDEPDEALPEGCSSAERRRDGGEEWWRLELSVRVKEGARELGTEGKRGQ
jgi:hypothetical protein